MIYKEKEARCLDNSDHVEVVRSIYNDVVNAIEVLCDLLRHNYLETLVYQVNKQEDDKTISVDEFNAEEGMFKANHAYRYIKVEYQDSTKNVPRLPGIVAVHEQAKGDVYDAVLLVNMAKKRIEDYLQQYSKRTTIIHENKKLVVNDLLFQAVAMVNTSSLLRQIHLCDDPIRTAYSFYWNRTPVYQKIKDKDSYLSQLGMKAFAPPPALITPLEWQQHINDVIEHVKVTSIDKLRIVRPRMPDVVIQSWSEQGLCPPLKTNIPIIHIGKINCKKPLLDFNPQGRKRAKGKQYKCLSDYLHLNVIVS